MKPAETHAEQVANFRSMVQEVGLNDLYPQLVRAGYTTNMDIAGTTAAGLAADLGMDPSTTTIQHRRLLQLLVTGRGISPDVSHFCNSIGLPQYIPLFVEQGFTTREDLLLLDADDMVSTLRVPLLAHRKRILSHISTLKDTEVPDGCFDGHRQRPFKWLCYGFIAKLSVQRSCW